MTSAENSISEPLNLKILLGRIPLSPPYKVRTFATREHAPPPPPPLQKTYLRTRINEQTGFKFAANRKVKLNKQKYLFHGYYGQKLKQEKMMMLLRWKFSNCVSP